MERSNEQIGDRNVPQASVQALEEGTDFFLVLHCGEELESLVKEAPAGFSCKGF